MAARTILNTTQTDVTTYSSGPLDVGDVSELSIQVAFTAGSGGTPTVMVMDTDTSRTHADYGLTTYCLSAFDLPAVIDASDFSSDWYTYQEGEFVYPLGNLHSNIGHGLITPLSFGDRIQIDLTNPQGCTVTFSVSIIGK